MNISNFAISKGELNLDEANKAFDRLNIKLATQDINKTNFEKAVENF